ncbi:MAG: L,D-transpeptidase family protein [Akkermansiaceae bacterium]|nr:L,D-transpeptidase family protein [Akkermansiaceae bacterium]
MSASTGASLPTGYLAAFRHAAPVREGLPHEQGFWDAEGINGPPSIRIHRSEQKAYFYKGTHIVGMSPVATGKTTHTTPGGTFKISQKSKDHKSSLYGVIRDNATGQVVNDDADTRKHKAAPGQTFENAPMPYFMRFNGGIGMHVGHLPGYAASHGCVRMPKPMAIKFFENVEVGTPVIVE